MIDVQCFLCLSQKCVSPQICMLFYLQRCCGFRMLVMKQESPKQSVGRFGYLVWSEAAPSWSEDLEARPSACPLVKPDTSSLIWMIQSGVWSGLHSDQQTQIDPGSFLRVPPMFGRRLNRRRDAKCLSQSSDVFFAIGIDVCHSHFVRVACASSKKSIAKWFEDICS